MEGIWSSGMDKDTNSAKKDISDDQRIVEAALFSAGEALDTNEVAEATGLSYSRTSEALEDLVEASKTREGALEVVKQEDKYTLRPKSKRSIGGGLVAAGKYMVTGAGKAGGGESGTPSSGVEESSALLPGGGESIASSGGGPSTLPGGGEPDTLPGGGARGGGSTNGNANTKSITSGGKTTGLRTTLGLMKSAFTLALIVIVIAAGADVYKMYNGGITINLEDHITNANFWLTPDEESIVGEISFDIPKMGYFEKSIDVLIHLKILESDPTTEDDFNFDYTLGSGNQTYEEFELNNLDPVTRDKIDKEEPLDIEYTITITIVYLGVELGPTTSEIGTKITTVQTN
jgi:hypothetical protein|tara:strand:- start:536 stop:1573 length:1038 start_codon:yes stop_codon:yes gene_type:complete